MTKKLDLQLFDQVKEMIERRDEYRSVIDSLKTMVSITDIGATDIEVTIRQYMWKLTFADEAIAGYLREAMAKITEHAQARADKLQLLIEDAFDNSEPVESDG